MECKDIVFFAVSLLIDYLCVFFYENYEYNVFIEHNIYI